MYLWVHSEEGVGAPAAQGRSLEGLAVIKMIVIVQVSNLQNKKQVTFSKTPPRCFKSPPSHFQLPEETPLPALLPTCASGKQSVLRDPKDEGQIG